jgi:MFS family permease
VITSGLVVRIGLSQLICWGISYYLIGVLGGRITADLGWSPTLTYGGFSVALIVMGLSSPLVGRLIDRRGGRPVMLAGSCLSAIGCAGVSASSGPATYYAAWVCLGLAMRMTLYEAAFAALVRIGGPHAKRPISQVTLLGGLASTVFWPIGHSLADAFGWRKALLAYGAMALFTVPLHLAIPPGTYERSADTVHVEHAPLAVTRRERLVAGSLYALIATITTFLNSAMSAHMIGILVGLGVSTSIAVWISTLRGIGQSSARLCEVLFGAAMSPLALGVLATSLLPLCFVAGLFSGLSRAAAIGFAFLFGAGNGLVTIVRGSLPLVLFDPRSYGSVVGVLLVPSFLVSALAPLAYAFIIDRFGEGAALHVSAALATVALAATVVTSIRFGRRRAKSPRSA